MKTIELEVWFEGEGYIDMEFPEDELEFLKEVAEEYWCMEKDAIEKMIDLYKEIKSKTPNFRLEDHIEELTNGDAIYDQDVNYNNGFRKKDSDNGWIMFEIRPSIQLQTSLQ